ncbi:hypothetical protein TorRG33x02_248740 [Trema orientale]|uniref:Uncharacterized protein n=1 Tax=Trema orientale TaxID=63057 RepID=A0A2P5DKI9_TREOI|nr:hypothetical protein TorRG33x02_248740 [Trema orientale]
MVNPPNPPLPPRFPPSPLPPATSAASDQQNDQMSQVLAMLRSLQQEVTALKSRDAAYNGNSSSGSQAAPSVHNEASPRMIQIGTPDVVVTPPAAHATPAAPTAPTTPSNVITATTPGTSREYFTKDEILEMMRTGSTDKNLKKIDFQPLYTSHILSKSYPKDYINPRFRIFDGRTGNAKKHVVGFIDDLGAYTGDEELRMREFSKSLTGRAYD